MKEKAPIVWAFNIALIVLALIVLVPTVAYVAQVFVLASDYLGGVLIILIALLLIFVVC